MRSVLPWFAQVDGKMMQDGCCVVCGSLLMEKLCSTRVVPKVMSNFFFVRELGTADEGE